MSTPSANSDRRHCRALYWNTLTLFHQPTGTDYPALAHNIANTERCDTIADFSTLRQQFRNTMTPATYDKIASGQQLTGLDHLWTKIAVDSNRVHTRLSLLRALPPHYTLYYYVAYRPGEVITAAGVTAAAWLGGRAAWRIGRMVYGTLSAAQSAGPSNT